jgi:glycosyltransferase involved in cell wall biosynthesis
VKVSIVTISYNQAQYLPACIESILSQTACEIEYIVVDPGSTDGSRAIIDSYGDRIIKVYEKDFGPADGLNRGFAKATGDIFGFINSDDYLLPGALKHVAHFFSKHDDQVFVTGHGYSDTDGGAKVQIYPSVLTTETMLYQSAVMFQQATFFPAKLFQQAGGFNINNKTCWDFELFLSFLLAGAKHYVLPSDLAAFRLHAGSISGSGRVKAQYFAELDQLFLQHQGRHKHTLDKVFTFYLRLKRVSARQFAKFGRQRVAR